MIKQTALTSATEYKIDFNWLRMTCESIGPKDPTHM